MKKRLFRVLPLTAVLAVATLSGCSLLGKAGPAEGELLGVEEQRIPINQIEDPYFHLISAELYRQRGRWAEALHSYMLTFRFAPSPEIAQSAFEMALAINDLETAQMMARRWVDMEASNESTAALATINLRLGNIDLAVDAFSEFVSVIEGGPAMGFAALSGVLMRDEYRDVAIPVMQKLAALHVDSPDAALGLARVAFRFQADELSYESLNVALGLDPNMLDAHLLRAQLIMKLGDPERAIQALQAQQRKHPADTRITTAIANLEMQSGQYAAAKKRFKSVLGQAPDDVTVLIAMAKLSLQLREIDEAAGYFQHLFELNEEPSLAAYYLGAIAEQNGEPERAIEWYSRVVQGNQLLKAQERIAYLYISAGDSDAAIQHLRYARNQLPHFADHFYRLEAEVLNMNQRTIESLNLYNEALAQYPNDSDLRYGRAFVLLEADSIDLAIVDLEHAAKVSPNDPRILNALGYVLSDKTTRYDEAYDYIARSLDINPDEAATQDSMGWVLYKQGKYAAAAEFLRLAFTNTPEPEIAAHLGEVLWVSGDKVQAEDVWWQSISRSIGQDQDVMKETVRRLAPRLAEKWFGPKL